MAVIAPIVACSRVSRGIFPGRDYSTFSRKGTAMGRAKWRLYWFAYGEREGTMLWDPEPQCHWQELADGRPREWGPVRLEEDDGGRRVRIGVVRGDEEMDLEDGLDVGQLADDDLDTLLDDEQFEAQNLADRRFREYLEERHPEGRLAGDLRSRQIRPS
jgi:hypothetical protein